MIYLGFFLLGGISGLAVRYYLQHFANQICQEIFSAYCEIFPENAPRFQPEKSALRPIKCGQNYWYFLGYGGIFCAILVLCEQPFSAIFYNFSVVLLWLIARIDWHYQLISPALCQALLACGVALAYFQLSLISLEQSLASATIGFGIFWSLFHLAKWHYRQEALGRGDYWLLAGLASFLPWQSLPLVIFVASLSGLIYAFFLHALKQKARKSFLPFAPFLIFGAVITFAMNVLG